VNKPIFADVEYSELGPVRTAVFRQERLTPPSVLIGHTDEATVQTEFREKNARGKATLFHLECCEMKMSLALPQNRDVLIAARTFLNFLGPMSLSVRVHSIRMLF
jgi:hypothetical protein